MKLKAFLFIASILVVSLAGCTDTPSPEPEDAGTPSDSTEVLVNPEDVAFEELKTWKIDAETGYALLIEEELNQASYIAFVKDFVTKKNPISVQIFSTKGAFESYESENMDKDYEQGFILVYLKDVGEIVWMQEDGPLANLQATPTSIK